MKEFYSYHPDLIISGGGGNVDNAAEEYANRNNIPFELYVAEWQIHGRGAGPIRNKAMAEAGTQLLVVWDGKSRGSKNMIREMNKRNKRVCLAHVIPSGVEFIQDYKL
jgi:hypothetical protein